MLHELYISNLAIIEQISLTLERGLNVLTGETGAGKSIVIDALELVLGGRASPDMVRAGEEKLLVEALFSVTPGSTPHLYARLQEMGLNPEELVLSREVLSSGRSTCRVNGRPVTLGMLRQITRGLVDLHGQHEHQLLLDRSTHLDFVDAVAGLGSQRHLFQVCYQKWQEAKRQLEEARESARERARRLDLLDFQVAEIDSARLRPGEDEELSRERQLLASAERLHAAARMAFELLYGDSEGTVHDHLARALNHLQEGARLDPRLRESANQLGEVLTAVDEVARQLAMYADAVQFDPGRLAEVEARLAAIDALKRKYADTVAGVLAFRKKAAIERDKLMKVEESIRNWEEEKEACELELSRLAQGLSRSRKEAADRLARRVEQELRHLAMPSASFGVRLWQDEDSDGILWAGEDGGTLRVAARPSGVDQAEFLLSANPGEPPRPLDKVGSGGELARAMLALKAVLAEADDVPILVFDEVDAGVGGHAAATLGQKLREVARNRQVVVVTHLAAVAAFADFHLLVEKKLDKERTAVSVQLLEEEARIRELARMLGGGLSEEAIQHARRLRWEACHRCHDKDS